MTGSARRTMFLVPQRGYAGRFLTWAVLVVMAELALIAAVVALSFNDLPPHG